MIADDCFGLLLSTCSESGGGAEYEYNASADIIAQNPGAVLTIGLALGGLLFGYILHRRGLRPKILDYDIWVDSPLLSSASSRVEDPLSVSWNGRSVRSPKVIEVFIANTGREAVVRSDYSDPIRILLRDGKLLGASLRDLRPADVVREEDMTLDADSHSVRLVPELLNSGDSFIVQLIVDGFGAEALVKSRFKNQERPMRHVPARTPRSIQRATRIAASIAAVTIPIVFAFAPGLAGTSTLAIVGWRAVTAVIVGSMVFGIANVVGTAVAGWLSSRRHESTLPRDTELLTEKSARGPKGE